MKKTLQVLLNIRQM